jgi:hypothetical protein
MAQRPRYRCEWLAELDEMERRHIAKMLPALRILLSAPAVGRALEPTSDWPPEQARAHNGIASSHHAVGDPGQGRHHWQQALNLYAELGLPKPIMSAPSSARHMTTATASRRPPQF